MKKFRPGIILRTRKDLVSALAEKGLPRSTPRLNLYEAQGVIQYPRFGIKRGENGFDRLYTDQELLAAVESISKHAQGVPSFGNK